MCTCYHSSNGDDSQNNDRDSCPLSFAVGVFLSLGVPNLGAGRAFLRLAAAEQENRSEDDHSKEAKSQENNIQNYIPFTFVYLLIGSRIVLG